MGSTSNMTPSTAQKSIERPKEWFSKLSRSDGLQNYQPRVTLGSGHSGNQSNLPGNMLPLHRARDGHENPPAKHETKGTECHCSPATTTSHTRCYCGGLSGGMARNQAVAI